MLPFLVFQTHRPNVSGSSEKERIDRLCNTSFGSSLRKYEYIHMDHWLQPRRANVFGSFFKKNTTGPPVDGVLGGLNGLGFRVISLVT
jgi:hypothetical protein